MEASQAAQGNGDAGQADGAGEAQQAQAGPDLSALAEQLGSMHEGQEQLRQLMTGLQERLPAQEEAAQEDLPQLDLSQFGIEADEAQQIAQSVAALAEQRSQSQADQMIQQHIAPLAQQLTQIQHAQEVRDLVAEFPEIGEEQTAQNVVDTAKKLAEAAGQPQLANAPWLYRLVYLSGRAIETAQAEGEEGPQAAHLEGGGGAGPAGGQQGDLKAQILEQNRGSSVLPFG